MVELSNKQVTEMCITYKWGTKQYLGRTRFCSAVPQSVISACLLDVSQSLQNKPATNVRKQLQKKKKGKSRGTTTKDNQNLKQKDVTNGKEPRLPGPHTYLFFKTQADRWLFIVADNYLHLDIVFQNVQREKYTCFDRISLRYFLLKERNSE